MFAVFFYENNSIVLNQALRNIPSIDEDIRIKGRKGKVTGVQEMEENIIHVQVEFEKVVDKNKNALKDLGKNKKR
ncbi:MULTISPECIES: hypothetical protein [unclassified Bacillus (in: firmicutes)]|uniref:hypothetical protein n=1 Tax=unclassified Bacillus (in: firmicutes) TaxID=185979 RepID=UPI0006AEC752|nr:MULTISPECIES: hypothetical protein [unclassified Bacillus (in: firmicutes)]ALC86096.1 preprotein translocase subunit SecA [Bacillus sp. FJAT-22090]MDF2068563.1 hypothetical protein [Bacillus sp. Cr_A10]